MFVKIMQGVKKGKIIKYNIKILCFNPNIKELIINPKLFR